MINKTPRSAGTNRIIGGRAPGARLSRVHNSAGIDEGRMDAIIAAHHIDPALLRGNDFRGVMEGRQASLLRRIESAMGKPISKDGILLAEDATDTVDEQSEE